MIIFWYNLNIKIYKKDKKMGRYYSSWQEEIYWELKDEIGKKKSFRYDRLLPVALTREECLELINSFQKGKKAQRNRLIIRRLYSTGMRIGELENIKLCDINFQKRTLFIREGKGSKDRYVLFDRKTSKNIKEYIEIEKIEGRLLNVKKRQTQYIIEKAGRTTKITKKYEEMERNFSAHSLRHAFATHCFENGMDLFTLKKLLGHEYFETTEIYVNTSTKFDKQKYDITNPFKKL